MLSAGETQSFGLEVSNFETEDDGDFLALGIVLEERFWDWLSLSIGTVGYFDYLDSAGNPIGLLTNIGWEPRWDKPISPFKLWKTDVHAAHTIPQIALKLR